MMTAGYYNTATKHLPFIELARQRCTLVCPLVYLRNMLHPLIIRCTSLIYIIRTYYLNVDIDVYNL